MFVRPSSRENKEYNSRSVFRVSPRSDFTLVSLTHRSLGQLFLPRSFWNAPMQTQRYIVCGAKEETEQTHAGLKEVEVELPLQTRGAAPVGPSLVYL
jgi:hypothetical protein